MVEPQIADLPIGKIHEIANLTHAILSIKERFNAGQEASKIQASLPVGVLVSIENTNVENDNSTHCMALASLSPIYLAELSSAYKTILEFAESILEAKEAEFTCLQQREDIEALKAFCKLLCSKRLRPRSKSQLFQFLNNLLYDEDGYLVIQTGNDSLEARFRYHVPEEFLEWFRLDQTVK